MSSSSAMSRNVRLMPWFALFRGLTFWQATWFLYFQSELSAAEAILLYVIYDVSTLVFEVPSGYMSDRLGRRKTLIASAVAGVAGVGILSMGVSSFALFALAQVMLGAQSAFLSGTDSALVYESLAAEDRADEMETMQVRLWRFSFSGLAISAVTGGAMALASLVLPFVATTVSALVLLGLALSLREPPHQGAGGTTRSALRSLSRAFSRPVILWLFLLGLLMYGYSHIPFVFGQPFILDALARLDLSAEAPFVSGSVTTLMMLTSLATSLLAPFLRQRLGLGLLLLLAFGMQVALAGGLSLGNAPWMIGLLFLRMVPDALSTPFIVAHLQPLLEDETRATFLSLKSFLGRMAFALSLMIAVGSAQMVDRMSYAEISAILFGYAFAGFAFLLAFAATMRRAVG